VDHYPRNQELAGSFPVVPKLPTLASFVIMSDSHKPPITFVAPELACLAPLFPGYEIVSLIATGGMGAVYRAVQKSLERMVAIKILPQEFSKDATFCAGFEAEAKAMARLNHPNLIGVYDFGEINGMLFIIMEYVPGKSLFHAAHGIALDADETIKLVTGICNGLAHAHEYGIIHRDIKPSNILLDLNGQPKIGDFGLARPIEKKIRENEEIYGTPDYTAPEVVHSPHLVDYRADIFSVGVILHELITGRLPDDDSQPPSAIKPCDPRFDAIICRATDPRPKYRYTSVHEIAKDLHAITSAAGPRELARTSHPVPPQPARSRNSQANTQQEPANYMGLIMWGLSAVLAIIIYYVYTNQQKVRQIVLTQPPPVAPAPDYIPKLRPVAPVPDYNPKPRPVAPIPEDIPKPRPVAPVPEDIPKPRPIEPIPEDIPKPRPIEPIPEDIPKPRPDPTPTVTDKAAPPELPVSKFDVPAFFTKARKIMQDKAAPHIASREKNLKKNLADFEQDEKRLIRKYASNVSSYSYSPDYYQKAYQGSLETFIKQCEKKGNRLSEATSYSSSSSYSFDSISGSRAIKDEYLEKQNAIDATLQQQLAGLAPIYILGLEKQIERLNAVQDTASIALINAEINQTRTTATYLPNLMLGIDPDKPSAVKSNSRNYGRKVTVSGSEPGHEGENAIDNNSATYWSAPSNSRTGWMEIDLGTEMTIIRAVINQATWPRIRRFEIQAQTANSWKTAALGTSIDASNRIKFSAPVKGRYFRLNILEATDCPIIAEFGLFEH
jgi:serine/threonine protein kinase